jgi:hypothetical protein
VPGLATSILIFGLKVVAVSPWTLLWVLNQNSLAVYIDKSHNQATHIFPKNKINLSANP